MSGRPRHHGLSAREQEIMDLHDAGLRASFIADELGLDVGHVQAVINTYDFATCWSNSDGAERKIRDGCRRYTAALAATGRRYA